MTSLYLIRHAQAQGNVEKRFQGRTDLPLTELGRMQCQELVLRMKAIPLTAVYASPLSRAMDTAAGVARSHGLELITREGLVEMDGGAFENVLFEELSQRFPEAFRLFLEQPHLFPGVGGGETLEQVYERMGAAVMDIVRGNAGGSIAIVSHAAAIRCFLCFLLGLSVEHIEKVPWMPNTGVSHIIFDAKMRPNIHYMGDDTHIGAHLKGEKGREMHPPKEDAEDLLVTQ